MLIKPEQKSFAGFENYLFFLKDKDFWIVLKNTFLFMLVSLSATFVLGFIYALMINRFEKIKSILTLIIIPPMMLSSAIIGRIWRVMFDFNGPINGLLAFFHIDGIKWLANPKISLFSVALVDTWQWTPFVFLIFMGGLYALPKDVYEAASIDGASSRQIFLNITLPLLKPFRFVILIFRIIDTIRIFDIIFVLTKGGPGLSTEIISLTIFRYGLKYFSIGQGTALSILLLIIVSTIIILVTKLKIFKIE